MSWFTCALHRRKNAYLGKYSDGDEDAGDDPSSARRTSCFSLFFSIWLPSLSCFWFTFPVLLSHLCWEAKSKMMAMKMLGCWLNGQSLLYFFLFFSFSLRVCLMLELDDEDEGESVLVCQSYLLSFSVSVLRALLLWSSAEKMII